MVVTDLRDDGLFVFFANRPEQAIDIAVAGLVLAELVEAERWVRSYIEFNDKCDLPAFNRALQFRSSHKSLPPMPPTRAATLIWRLIAPITDWTFREPDQVPRTLGTVGAHPLFLHVEA